MKAADLLPQSYPTWCPWQDDLDCIISARAVQEEPHAATMYTHTHRHLSEVPILFCTHLLPSVSVTCLAETGLQSKTCFEESRGNVALGSLALLSKLLKGIRIPGISQSVHSASQGSTEWWFSNCVPMSPKTVPTLLKVAQETDELQQAWLHLDSQFHVNLISNCDWKKVFSPFSFVFGVCVCVCKFQNYYLNLLLLW
jgi:hypothetical protein